MPIYVVATSPGYSLGHGVVCFGCKQIDSNQYLHLWNPGTNGGNGSAILVKYLSSGTVFSYGGSSWTWVNSAYRYN